MNILYISTVFPKESENSTIYTDLAETLVARGHTVFVVAAEEKKKSLGTRLVSERGCTVLRVKVGDMYDVGLVRKGVSILTLERIMRAALQKHLRGKHFDLILFEAPPVTLSGVVARAKKLFGAPAFLMMKDIFPQNAVDIGMMKKGGVVERLFRRKEKKLYAVADRIGCMSKGNLAYIREHAHVGMDKLSVFPNTKRFAPPRNKDLSIRAKYAIPQEKVVFVFGGNMGKPQGLDFLAAAIGAASHVKDAFFVLVGRGTERERVRAALKGTDNALVLDGLPRDEYEELISSCDVGIISLDHRFTIPNYPSRILSYMEYAMPVLAATDPNTDFKDLIEDAKCGYWCESSDVRDFVDAVTCLCDAETRKTLGENGRQYALSHFPAERSAELLEEYTNTLSSPVHFQMKAR